MTHRVECDQCGKTLSTGQYLHVSAAKAKAGAFPPSEANDRDFCGEACLTAYYAKRTGHTLR